MNTAEQLAASLTKIFVIMDGEGLETGLLEEQGQGEGLWVQRGWAMRMGGMQALHRLYEKIHILLAQGGGGR